MYLYLFLVTVLGGNKEIHSGTELFFSSSFFILSVRVNWKVSEVDAWVGEREGGLELNLKACAKMDEPRCEKKARPCS